VLVWFHMLCTFSLFVLIRVISWIILLSKTLLKSKELLVCYPSDHKKQPEAGELRVVCFS